MQRNLQARGLRRPRRGRAAVVLALLVLFGACGWAAYVLLAGGAQGEAASPDPGAVAPVADDGLSPLVPRLEIGRGSLALQEGQRPPLEERPTTPAAERFEGNARIEGYLDVAAPYPPPQRWTLLLEPSKVLIGGEHARAQRIEFENGETEFTLEDVPLGGYEIQAEAPGMSGVRELLLLARPDAQHVVVRVGLRPAAFVEGAVRVEGGAPVADLPLALQPLAGGDALQTRSDANGAYLFEQVPDGEYRLFAGHPMSPVAPPLDVAVAAPSLHPPAILVPPLGQIDLTVVGSDGLPVAGVRIEGWGSEGGHVDVRTDDAGQALARFLPAGRISLRAVEGEGAQRRRGRGSLDLTAGASERLEIRLTP